MFEYTATVTMTNKREPSLNSLIGGKKEVTVYCKLTTEKLTEVELVKRQQRQIYGWHQHFQNLEKTGSLLSDYDVNYPDNGDVMLLCKRQELIIVIY